MLRGCKRFSPAATHYKITERTKKAPMIERARKRRMKARRKSGRHSPLWQCAIRKRQSVSCAFVCSLMRRSLHETQQVCAVTQKTAAHSVHKFCIREYPNRPSIFFSFLRFLLFCFCFFLSSFFFFYINIYGLPRSFSKGTNKWSCCEGHICGEMFGPSFSHLHYTSMNIF